MASKLWSGGVTFAVPMSWIGGLLEGSAKKHFATLKSKIEVYNAYEVIEDNIWSILDTVVEVRAKGLSQCIPVFDEIVHVMRVLLLNPAPDVVHHTLVLLDFVIKNCGFVWHGMIGRERFMKTVAHVARKHSAGPFEANKKAGNFALDCIQAWGEAFYPHEELYPHFYQTYTKLRYKYKMHFPRQVFDPTRVPIVLGELTQTETTIVKALLKSLPLDCEHMEHAMQQEVAQKLAKPAAVSVKAGKAATEPMIISEDSTPSNPRMADCAVCFESLVSQEGFTCLQKCGTFTCWDCLLQSYDMAGKPGAIQGGSSTDGELFCSDIKCRYPVKMVDLAKNGALEAVLKACENFKLHVHTTKKVTEAMRQQEDQIRGEYARIEQIKDADEKAAMKVRRKIVDEALTLRCPRCSAAFMEFDGCFAVSCGNNACRCGFCAWCLTDCGHDAHAHVLQCPENANRTGSYNAYFNTHTQFQNHHKKKRISKVQALLREAELSITATEKLKTFMTRDLGDLGIEVKDVFAQQRESAAPVSQPSFLGMKWPAAGYRKV